MCNQMGERFKVGDSGCGRVAQASLNVFCRIVREFDCEYNDEPVSAAVLSGAVSIDAKAGKESACRSDAVVCVSHAEICPSDLAARASCVAIELSVETRERSANVHSPDAVNRVIDVSACTLGVESHTPDRQLDGRLFA